MTELQFLLELLLKHKLPKGTKQLVADRIAEVEKKFSQPTIVPPMAQHVSVRSPIHMPVRPELDAIAAAQVPMPPMQMPKGEIDKETGRAVVSTGNGTRGPRKF